MSARGYVLLHGARLWLLCCRQGVECVKNVNLPPGEYCVCVCDDFSLMAGGGNGEVVLAPPAGYDVKSDVK